MEFYTWILFTGVALISVLSPGPAVLLSVTNSLRYGVGTALVSSLGNITGLFIVSAGAALGLGAVLQTSALMFGILKCCGAFYLIYIGIRQWQSRKNPFSGADDPGRDPGAETLPGRSGLRVFRQGVLVALFNPKPVLFFTALFPQFMDVSRPVAGQFIILTLTFMVFSFVALAGYAAGAGVLKDWLSRGRRPLWMNRISGTVFIGFGLGILGMKQDQALPA